MLAIERHDRQAMNTRRCRNDDIRQPRMDAAAFAASLIAPASRPHRGIHRQHTLAITRIDRLQPIEQCWYRVTAPRRCRDRTPCSISTKVMAERKRPRLSASYGTTPGAGASGGLSGARPRQHVGIEQEAAQKSMSRTGVWSRSNSMPPGKVSSRSAKLCFGRAMARFASSAASTLTRTAAGLPSRVIVTNSPAAASSTNRRSLLWPPSD